MTGSTISGETTISVTLGSASYPSPLTILPVGIIDPFAGGFYGATALVATISGGAVLNQGTITGGRHDIATGAASSGGIGAVLANGSLMNLGSISGGAGGYSYLLEQGGAGGYGVVVTSGGLTNNGTISGGSGGGFGLVYAGGPGGVGAGLTNSSLINNGLVVGGDGGISGGPFGSPTKSPLVGGSGGVGVDATHSSVINSSSIAGGNGGYSYGSPLSQGGAGVSLAAGSTLINMGRISGGTGGATYLAIIGGTGGDGVDIANSNATNAGTATILGGEGGYGGRPGNVAPISGVGGDGGIGVYVTSGSLANSGVIRGGQGADGTYGGGVGGTGVALANGATLTNTGNIAGGAGGVGGDASIDNPVPFVSRGGSGVDVANSSLTNLGIISGGGDATGVDLTNGTLTNDGMIAGGGYVNSFYTGGTGVDATGGVVTNNGTITGTYYGVVLASGASVTNTAGAVISGDNGLSISGGGTVVDAGTIGVTGGYDNNLSDMAVLFTGAGTDLLVDDPGALFVGTIAAQGSPATLELASAGSAGAITGIGTSFSGFGTIAVDPNASWVVSGSVSGSGTFSLGAGSDLTFDGGVAATSPVQFAADTGMLRLSDPAGFAATVYGFQPGDAFDFTSLTSSGSITAGVNGSNDLTLTSDGTLLTMIQLDPLQSFSGAMFHAGSDGHTGTLVTETPLCFLAGTLIATPAGETPVEHLREGDMVLTAQGIARPVVWIGTGRVLATRGRRNAATPVIVRKGALADNVPHHDLRVTKAHALCVGGALIPVEFLINHRSIHWDDRAQEVVLYHVELETHDVLLANGAPAETYRDDGNRQLFQNANSGWHLPAKPPCAAILTGGDIVDAAWLQLLERAGPRPGLPLTDDPDLHLLVDGRRVDAVSRGGAFHVFRMTGVADGAHIASRAAAPQELGLARDPRLLGVALQRVIIRQGSRSRVIAANDLRLTHGFYAFEEDNGLRWTDGNAHLPKALFAGFLGPLEVVLLCGGAVQYVAEGSRSRAA